MKNRNKAVILILIFLIASLGIKWFIKSQKGTGVKVPEEESIGAIFPQEKEYSMQVLDPSVLEVPRDYQAQTAKLDEVIEGKISSQLIESEFPKIKFSAKDSIGQEHWVEATLQTEKKPNLPAVKNSVINWNGIITDIDLEYKVYDGFLKETFTLKNEKAQREFRFTLTTSDDVELTDKEGGYILGRKKSSGENLFMLKSPQGIDAKNQRIDYSYRLEKDNLILYPNRQWQLDFASFPVKVDPSISVVSWDEALVQVGENCQEAACGKDGDIIAVKPAGWNWGTDERKEFVIVKIPKLNITDRDELNSRTINPPEPGDDGKVVPYPAEKRERIHQIPDLVRYGIDYTQLVSKGQLEKIRQKKDTNPVLDARNKREFIKKKVNPLSSVIPDDRRLVYQEVKQTLIKRIFSKIMTKVFAQTVVVRSIGSAGRNYSTIAAWETAQQGNLVSLNEIHRGEMYKDSVFNLTASVTIDGSTTDSTRYMHLTVAPIDRHNGTAGTGVVVDHAGVSAYGIGINDDYTIIDWIESRNHNGGNGTCMYCVSTANGVLLRYLLIHGFDSANSSNGIKGSDASYFTIRNSILYNGRQGIRSNQSCTPICTATIENLTVYNMSGIGIYEDAASYTVRNTISVNSSNDDFRVSTSSQAYNISSDATSAGTGSMASRTVTANCSPGSGNWVIFKNLTTGSEDLHLQNCSENDALNTGTTLTGFSDDIDTQSRPQGSAWDIGADEFLVPVTPTPTRTPTPLLTPTPTPAGGFGVVTIDNVSSGSQAGGNVLSVSHTTSGTNRLMLVGVSLDNNGSTTLGVKDVTYNGIFLAEVGSISNSDDARTEIWRLIAPPTGTYNVVITLDSAICADCGFVAGVATFNGVNQTTPLGTFVSNLNTSSTASVNVTSATGELVFDTVSCETCTSLTVGAGQTQHWNLSGGANTVVQFGAASTETGAASVNMSWSLGFSDHWSIGAVPIRPASLPTATPSPTPTVTPTQGPTATPTLTPTPTSVPIGANLDAINSIYSYSGLGYYFLDPNFDGNRTTGEDTTIFLISGSLEINQNFTLSDPRDSVIFIVNGNIRISADVTFLPGVYISSQTFSIAESDLPITIEGMVYAKDVNLLRTYISETEPTYQIIYQPRYLVKLLPYLGRAQVNWQEVSP